MERFGSKWLFILCFLYKISTFASPLSLSYQGRIVDSSGRPLEHSAVAFEFTITNPQGTCVLYREQLNNVDMRNSKGVFDAPIGTGVRSYPTTPGGNLIEVFSNSTALNCLGGSVYNPQLNDGRLLRVQFFDGHGWKLISPDNVIRSVPYANFSASALKLGTRGADDFILKEALPPACGTGQVLTFDGSAFVCVTDLGGSGVVSAVTGSGPITVTGTGTVTVGALIGQTAGTLAAGDDARFTNPRPPTGSAGGDLTGSYPSPVIGPSAVTEVKLADDAVSSAKIQDGTITTSDLAPGSLPGQTLRFSGTTWQINKLNYMDLVNSANSSPWPSSCSAGQYVTWVSVADGFDCVSFNSSAVTTALGFTPVSSTRIINTGLPATSGLIGGGDLSIDRTLSVNVGTGPHQIPQLDASGRLPVLDGSALTNLSAANLTGTLPLSRLPTLASTNLSDSTSLVRKSDIPGNCLAHQTLSFWSPSNTWTCTDISIDGSAFASQAPGRVLASPAGASGSPTFRALASTDLPDAITSALWTSNGGDIYRNSGRVGIGSTSPSNTLEVGSVPGHATYAIAAGAETYGVVIQTGATTSPVSGAALLVRNRNGGGTPTPILYGSNSGNVGIGTEAPAAKLDVNGVARVSGGYILQETSVSGLVGILLRQTGDSSANNMPMILWDSPDDPEVTRKHFVRQSGNNLMFESADSSSDGNSFVWNNGIHSMAISGDGKVGIGTATPSAKLHVDGGIKTKGYGRIIVRHDGTSSVSVPWTGPEVLASPDATFTWTGTGPNLKDTLYCSGGPTGNHEFDDVEPHWPGRYDVVFSRSGSSPLILVEWKGWEGNLKNNAGTVVYSGNGQVDAAIIWDGVTWRMQHMMGRVGMSLFECH